VVILKELVKNQFHGNNCFPYYSLNSSSQHSYAFNTQIFHT